MLPLSLSFITQAPTHASISKQGIIVDIRASQWVPLDASHDNSILLDTYDDHVLLFCPVGATFLRSVKKKDPLLLQVA